MKKTLALSMLLLGAASFSLTGCTKDDQTGDDSTTTNADGDDDVGDEEEEEEGEEDDGITFIPEDDFAAASECDPFLQDCMEGEKCVPYGSTGGNWDANKCVVVEGDGQPGDECTWAGIVEATDSCGADSVCWDVADVEGQLIGVCTEFCTGTPDDPQCPPDTSCLIANSGSINLCIQSCDPLLQDCEGEGLACFWAGSDFQCIFTTQDIATGEVCGFINDCSQGNLCANAENVPNCAGSACCAEFCALSDPQCTTDGVECVEFFEENTAPPGLEDVGLCIIPGA